MLNGIPDPADQGFDALLDWIKAQIAVIRKTPLTPEILKTFRPAELGDCPAHPLGPEADPAWRRFFLATLLADWASYDKPADRADYARLKYIMTSAYPFTRLWGCTLPGLPFAPMGYTSWYPIPAFMFDSAQKHSEDIDDRGILIPQRFADPGKIRHAYIFNFSIAKPLRRTPQSRRLIDAFLSDKPFDPSIGAMMITVSEDGRRFAERSNFVWSGDLTVQGETEALYVRHPATTHAYLRKPDLS